MAAADILAEFLARPKDVTVIPPRSKGVQVENNALRYARSLGMSIAQREPAQREQVARAVAFDKLSPEQALKHFPELEGAYKMLAQANTFALRMSNEEERSRFIESARSRISASLHQGKELAPADRQKGRDR